MQTPQAVMNAPQSSTTEAKATALARKFADDDSGGGGTADIRSRDRDKDRDRGRDRDVDTDKAAFGEESMMSAIGNDAAGRADGSGSAEQIRTLRCAFHMSIDVYVCTYTCMCMYVCMYECMRYMDIMMQSKFGR